MSIYVENTILTPCILLPLFMFIKASQEEAMSQRTLKAFVLFTFLLSTSLQAFHICKVLCLLIVQHVKQSLLENSSDCFQIANVDMHWCAKLQENKSKIIRNPRRQIMQKVTPFVAIEAQKMLSELTVSFFISTNHLNNY